MRLAIGSDHAGFALKEVLKTELAGTEHTVLDLGPESADRVDYPDFAHALCRAVTNGKVDRGILVCGTGLGMSMAANRWPGIRCVVCDSAFLVEMARRHNNANVLALGARVVDEALAKKLIHIFLESPFDGGRHEGRIQKIERT